MMEKTYKISGMTCGNCKATVEKTLSEIGNVEKVDANLETGEVSISMSEEVSLDVFKKALPDKYSISDIPDRNVFQSSISEDFNDSNENKSKIEQLKPLLLIILYIAVTGILLNFKEWNWGDFMLDFMGMFFIVFSFFKMLDLKGFPASFAMYDPLAKQIRIYGWIYPFMETALGLMFLMRIEVKIALVITLIILVITTVGVTRTLLDKKSIRCACLGTALKLPMTEATFIENAIMIVMALLMLTRL